MADLFSPVQIPRATFESLVEWIDAAVEKNLVALIIQEDFPFRTLEIVESEDNQNDSIDETLVDYFDQLIYFAFEHAPPSIVRAWAHDRDENLVDETTYRVDRIRQGMPNLERLWNAKSDSLVGPLVGLASDVIRGKSGDALSGLLYLAAARISATGAPDKSDITRLRVQLWPADIKSLIVQLEHMLGHLKVDESQEV